MDGYVRARTSVALPALRFVGRLTAVAALLLVIVLGATALAGMAVAAI